MSNEIIIPEGEEIIRRRNEGYIICNKCGAIMNINEQNNYVCPNCGCIEDGWDYEYDWGEDREWSPNMLDMFGEDIP